MRQNTCVYVKGVIYNANTQAPTREMHIYHFSTPYTGPPQRQYGVNTEICHLSLPSRKFRVGLGADMAEVQTAVAQMKDCAYE